ncbi:lethal giant larvae like, C-terminal-domain-containing protein [Coprinopsis sp. MPI-PUGE-AT-0042]|nr:lethal giant larvae like, C-terminal-domain-containing protein [Coprinopsis sp. MPI-PUGE-AT-0042]
MTPKPHFLEISNDIQDEADWVVGHLHDWDVPSNISAFAIEPTTRLLSIGTSDGFVFIQGGPAVEIKIKTPSSRAVKFLSFATLSQMLLVIDDEHIMHIWDLTTTEGPEYLKAARFDPVTSLHVSPSLAHVFIGLATGEIRTYDLACLRKSDYTVPNMWTLYQQSTKGSGALSRMGNASVGGQPCLDQQLHPRDLNRIFVAYPGGVILSDLTERRTVRAYELVLPPGAPGGFGLGTEDINTQRHPEVTCLTIHPSGHFFAVGHADGSIAFWAVDDDSNPLLVRTLDEEEVHLVGGERLENADATAAGQGTGPTFMREPIFKLAWSSFSTSADPRGGPTTLTILGGLDYRKGGYITVHLLPAFQPANPPGDSGTGQPDTLHPFFRAAMKESLTPLNASTYEVDGEVQDFLLYPREHLHLGGNHDPCAIMCLQSTSDGSRVTQAYRFPPSCWAIPLGQPECSIKGAGDVEPISIELPFPFINGSASVEDIHLMTVNNHVYEAIADADSSAPAQRLELTGGVAYADQTSGGESRSTKYQPRRILITQDSHGRFRFFDFSAQLLSTAPSEPLDRHFPHPFSGLTLDLSPSLSFLLEPQSTQKVFPNITAYSFAPEALELAVALQDGGVIICRSSAVDLEPPEDTTILMLNPSLGGSTAAISPSFLVQSDSRVQACSMSNIGFLAISYVNGQVAVIDMRGPRILTRLSTKMKHGRGGSISHRLSTDPDIAMSLMWSISPTESDPKARVRLLVARLSGTLDVYTLGISGPSKTWVIAEETSTKGVANPIQGGMFVLENKTGNPRGSQRDLFAQALRSSEEIPTPSIFVTVGTAGARSYNNIDGERLGKADWGTKHGAAITVQVVERLASKALAVVTDKQMGLAYSLPSLELISAFKLLPYQPRSFTIDQSGDWVAFYAKKPDGPIDAITHGTFFDVRRARSLPHINLSLKKCSVAQPQPVSMAPASLIGSWINYYQTMSGRQLDDLFGGPDRPIIVKAPKVEERAATDGGPSAAANLASSTAQVQSTLFNKLTAAMNERGQMLNDLEERFKSLETGSQNMVAQAKKLAAQQTAKSWFGF